MKKLFLLLTAVLLAAVTMTAQTRTITGTVVSAADDEPIVGATVHPVGGGQGTATDIDGQFSLTIPANVTQLQVTYVGMTPQTVKAVNGVKIALTENATALDEVMVVAYGTAKKSAYTGSASVIKADQIEGRQVTDAVSALAGAVSGVQVLTTNGQPGTAPSVRIRGIGSINGSSTPLYVVDGMPFDGDIATLNTMDIESMTVLKDAAAAALYGARGANGVIVITTKKGGEGDAVITFDARWGSNSRQVKGYDVIDNPYQYTEMAYQALRNGYAWGQGMDAQAAHIAANQALYTAFGAGYQIWNVPAGQQIVGTNGKLNPNAKLGNVITTRDADGNIISQNLVKPDSWYDNTFVHGLRQEYNLSVRGGTERFRYYASVGYLGDEGIIDNSNYNRLSSRVTAEYQAKKWLKLNASLAFNHVDMKAPTGQDSGTQNVSNAFFIVDNMGPVYPMFIRDGKGNILQDKATGNPIYDYGDNNTYFPGANRNFMSGSNPASGFVYDTNETIMDVLDAKWGATITPIENLNITGNVGYFLDNTREHMIMSPLYGSVKSNGGRASQEFRRLSGLNLQFLGTYRRTFADVHHGDIMLGYETYEQNSESVSAIGYHLYDPYNWAVNNTLNDENRKGSGGASGYSTRGFFGRLNYDYDSRYFASVSYRRDASSHFHPDHRWGDFFSVSAAWDAAKEKFMQPAATWLDLLKVKFSFGQQGNDNLYPGMAYGYYYTDIYAIQGSQAWSDGNMIQKGNPDLTWETSNAWNAGIDFSFWQGKLSGTVEYFLRETKDMLYMKPVAPSNGYTEVPMNVGSMRNSGLEFELNYRPINTKNITWDINLNGTFLKNKIIKLHPDLGGQMIAGIRILKEGSSLYNYYMVDYAGVNPDNGAALFWARETVGTDANGDPIYGKEYKTENYDLAADTNLKETGNLLPTFYGGFGTTLQAYGVDFSVAFSFQLGGRTYDEAYGGYIYGGESDVLGHAWHKDMLNAWTPENRNTDIPALNSMEKYNLGGQNTTFNLISSNYLSLNNITLGYTFPSKWTKKIGIESIRVYGAADNVALWSARKGLDPRMGFTSSGSGDYSIIRSISGGLKVVF